MATKLVRLKPHNPGRGFPLKRFAYFGIVFDAEKGWYRVSEEIAQYLSTVHQVPNDSYSQKAFDICDVEEAKAIDSKEKAESENRRKAAYTIEESLGRKDDGSEVLETQEKTSRRGRKQKDKETE